MIFIKKIAAIILLPFVLLLSSCASQHKSSAAISDFWELRIMHINDSHSYFDSHTQDIIVPGGTRYRTELGGMDKIAALIKSFESERNNVLKVHAGDAIMGTTYFTFFNGDAESELLNTLRFDAMAIGNHEFDLGDEFLADFIDKLNLPVISSNVIPASGNILENKFAPYIIKEYDGQKLGIIGLTIAKKTKESSSPSDEIEFLDEALSVQKYVDQLKTMGIGKIIVLCHDPYKKAMAWAPLVSEVDVVVSGDSHTLLGDDLAQYGFKPQGSYPTMLKNKDGDPLCLVQAWEYGKALGMIDVVFEGDVLKSAEGRSYLPLDEKIQKDSEKKDENGKSIFHPITKEERGQLETLLPQEGSLVVLEGDREVASLKAKYKNKKSDAEMEVIARVSEDLGHNRIPGDGRDGYSLALGSDIAPLVSKAFYELDPNSDLCIQNGGGVRVSIMAGDLTLKRCYELLPFSNTMYEIKMTGSEIKEVLEAALANAIDNGSTGSFPYAYAIRYDVDATKEAYSRLSHIEVLDRQTGSWAAIDPENIYVVITNNYIAGGKDGYTTFAEVQKRRPGYDTMTDYALSFIQYARKMTKSGLLLGKLPKEEHCMKTYIPKI